MRHITLILILAASTCLAADPPGAAVSLSSIEPDTSDLRVHFIDVGAGTAALIETPGGKHILIDGGKKGKRQYRKYVRHFLNDSPVDVLIVTHADDDHFYNLVGFIEDLDVGEFWNTGYQSRELQRLKRWPRFLSETLPALADAGTEDWTPLEDWVSPGEFETIDDNGTRTTKDDVEVQYLNVDKQPPLIDPVSRRRFEENERRNTASLVFKIVYGRTSFLFPGDINGREKWDDDQEVLDSEECELLERHNEHETYSLKATVLQVSHHGSDGASSLPFLRAVDPEWVVIPAGNAHDHPHGPAVERLEEVVDDEKILRTDDGPTRDPVGDDNFIFTADRNRIVEVVRVKVE